MDKKQPTLQELINWLSELPEEVRGKKLTGLEVWYPTDLSRIEVAHSGESVLLTLNF